MPSRCVSVVRRDSEGTEACQPQEKTRSIVVGVGMTKFEKPGRREGWDYPDMARESGTKALEDAGIDFSEVQQGFVGYCSGDSTSGQPGALRTGHDGHPDRQREQQLLHGFDGVVPCRTDDSRRTGRLHDRARLREDAARRAAGRRRGPRVTPWPSHQGARGDRRVRLPGGPVDVRRRGSRAHASIRHHRRAFRQDRLQEPQALGQQSVCAVPGGVHARRHPGRRR